LKTFVDDMTLSFPPEQDEDEGEENGFQTFPGFPERKQPDL
jgi:hypothetical protein